MKIIDLLIKKGFEVSYSDPYISKLKKYRNYKFYNLKSKLITKKLLHNTDAVVLLVDHDKFDKNYILKHSKTIIDTRNFFKTKSKKKLLMPKENLNCGIFISEDGFGHMVRQRAIISELLKTYPNIEITVFNSKTLFYLKEKFENRINYVNIFNNLKTVKKRMEA